MLMKLTTGFRANVFFNPTFGGFQAIDRKTPVGHHRLDRLMKYLYY